MVGNMPNNNYFNIPGVTTPSLQSAAQNNMARQPQSPIERVQLYTSFVNELSDIQARDVSQDGATNLFITRDYRHIYAKAWGADGKITTVDYEMKVNEPSPTQSQQAENTGNSVTPEMIMSALTSFQNEVNSRLTQLEQRSSQRSANYRDKKNNNYNKSHQEKHPPKGELNNNE